MSNLELLRELCRRAPQTAASTKKIEASLQKALSAAVVTLPLPSAHSMASANVNALEAHISGAMSAPDLKKIIKLWDPNRKLSRDDTITELRGIAVALLLAQQLPLPKQPRRR